MFAESGDVAHAAIAARDTATHSRALHNTQQRPVEISHSIHGAAVAVRPMSWHLLALCPYQWDHVLCCAVLCLCDQPAKWKVDKSELDDVLLQRMFVVPGFEVRCWRRARASEQWQCRVRKHIRVLSCGWAVDGGALLCPCRCSCNALESPFLFLSSADLQRCGWPVRLRSTGLRHEGEPAGAVASALRPH